MAYLTQTTAPTHSFSGRIQGALNNIKVAYKRHQIARETFHGLTELSNRELDDLGIARGDIGRIARESAQNADL